MMPTIKTVLARSKKTMANKAIGKISQVIGAVVDVQFEGELPAILKSSAWPVRSLPWLTYPCNLQ